MNLERHLTRGGPVHPVKNDKVGEPLQPVQGFGQAGINHYLRNDFCPVEVNRGALLDLIPDNTNRFQGHTR